MKSIATISLLLLIVASGCDKRIEIIDTSSENPISTIAKTAFDELNPDELVIYNALLIAANEFDNPISVRVFKCGIPYENDTSVKIELISKHNSEGDIRRLYYLKIAGKDAGSFSPYGSLPISYENPNVDVGNLNRALKEHWDDMGLN